VPGVPPIQPVEQDGHRLPLGVERAEGAGDLAGQGVHVDRLHRCLLRGGQAAQHESVAAPGVNDWAARSRPSAISAPVLTAHLLREGSQ